MKLQTLNSLNFVICWLCFHQNKVIYLQELSLQWMRYFSVSTLIMGLKSCSQDQRTNSKTTNPEFSQSFNQSKRVNKFVVMKTKIINYQIYNSYFRNWLWDPESTHCLGRTYYAWKMRALNGQWISAKMKVWHPW